jgi:hypothetical protein
LAVEVKDGLKTGAPMLNPVPVGFEDCSLVVAEDLENEGTKVLALILRAFDAPSSLLADLSLI